MENIDKDTDNLLPILIVENLSNAPKIAEKTDRNNDQKISQSDEILLTLIAEIIVEIILNDEL